MKTLKHLPVQLIIAFSSVKDLREFMGECAPAVNGARVGSLRVDEFNPPTTELKKKVYHRICEYTKCSAAFETGYPAKKYCSRSCYHLGRREKALQTVKTVRIEADEDVFIDKVTVLTPETQSLPSSEVTTSEKKQENLKTKLAKIKKEIPLQRERPVIQKDFQ